MKPQVSMHTHSDKQFEIKHKLPVLCKTIEDTKQRAPLRMPGSRNGQV
jgi:hypothetical protein